MINYYWTEKGKMYLCHICNHTFPTIITLQIDGQEVQFCEDCWNGEYQSFLEREKVNEDKALPHRQNIS